MFESNNNQIGQQMGDSLIVADDHRRKSQMVDLSSLMKLQDKSYQQEAMQQDTQAETCESETQTDLAIVVSTKCQTDKAEVKAMLTQTVRT